MIKAVSHYYGDTVRRLFVLAAVVMIGTLPFFTKEINQPLIIPLGVILVTGVAAGLTSPRHHWTAFFNVGVAIIGVVSFEWYAVDWYARYNVVDNFFWTTQVLAIIFLFALYFGLKTVRRVGSVPPNGESQESLRSFLDRPPKDDGGDA